MAALAFIQFLAIFAQWVFSFFYGAHIFCVCALGISVIFLILNCVYQCYFMYKFDRPHVPEDIERRIRLGKLSRMQARYNMKPIDPKFDSYKRKNIPLVYATYFMSVCFAWKFNKLFYCHFYDMPMF